MSTADEANIQIRAKWYKRPLSSLCFCYTQHIGRVLQIIDLASQFPIVSKIWCRLVPSWCRPSQKLGTTKAIKKSLCDAEEVLWNRVDKGLVHSSFYHPNTRTFSRMVLRRGRAARNILLLFFFLDRRRPRIWRTRTAGCFIVVVAGKVLYSTCFLASEIAMLRNSSNYTISIISNYMTHNASLKWKTETSSIVDDTRCCDLGNFFWTDRPFKSRVLRCLQ